MSTHSSATRQPPRRRRASAPVARSSSRTRFGRPVSGSRCARAGAAPREDVAERGQEVGLGRGRARARRRGVQVVVDVDLATRGPRRRRRGRLAQLAQRRPRERERAQASDGGQHRISHPIEVVGSGDQYHEGQWTEP